MRLILLLVIALNINAQVQQQLLLSGGTDVPNAPVDNTTTSGCTGSSGAWTCTGTPSITLTDASAATIYYSLSTTPNCTGTGTLYTGAFNGNSSTFTLKAIGCNGITGGGVLTSVYTISGGPFNYTIYSSTALCTAGSAPTTTCLGNATYPSLPSGASYTVTNTNSDLSVSNSIYYQWPCFTVTGASWPCNTTQSLQMNTGQIGDSVKLLFPSSTVQGTTSTCTPFYTSLAQNATFTSGDQDTFVLQNDSGGKFMNLRFSNAGGTQLLLKTECGVSGTGGNCTNGQLVTNNSIATNQWYMACNLITTGANGIGLSGVWNTPQNGGTILGTIAVYTGAALTGFSNYASLTELGAHAAPSSYAIYTGDQLACGITTGQTPCPFPVGPGLQLPSPVDSPGAGNYSSTQSVTVIDYSPVANVYYTTCGTPGCTPTAPTSSSTQYSGAFNTTPPQANSYIACYPSYVCSPVSTSDYVSPNATYISSGQCNAAVSTASCTISSLSIPSGSIIVTGSYIPSSTAGTMTISDSNSDTPSYGAAVDETTDHYWGRMGMMVAGTTVTSVTCTRTSPSSGTLNCVVAWYSPGTLSGILDQSTGQDQPDLKSWTSGTTATLAGSSDLIVGFWLSANQTSTPTDGSTQRITCSGGGSQDCGLQDRTAWGTPGAAVSGNWAATTYGLAAILAIK